MKLKAYAYLGIYLEGDPNIVTKELSIEADYVTRKGSKDPKRVIPKCSIIRIGKTDAISLPNGYLDLGTLIENLVNKLYDLTEELNDLKYKYSVSYQVAVVSDIPTTGEISTPSISLSTREIKFLHDIGADIDFDLYYGQVS